MTDFPKYVLENLPVYDTRPGLFPQEPNSGLLIMGMELVNVRDDGKEIGNITVGMGRIVVSIKTQGHNHYPMMSVQDLWYAACKAVGIETE